MKRKIMWSIPIILFFISVVIPFIPGGRITFDKSVSKNRILFQYETFGCGSVIGKVLDGGEEITSDFIEQYPNIGLNEIVFSEDSDRPKGYRILDETYTYVIEGEPVGVTKGAPECCTPKPAYNENVVEFKVNRWYFTSYIPYWMVGNIVILEIAFLISILSLLWVFVLSSFVFIRYIRKKRSII